MLFQEEGLVGAFTGYQATLFRDVPYTMAELGCYDALKGVVAAARGRRGQTSAEDELAAAALTGGLVGFLTNPLDVVRPSRNRPPRRGRARHFDRSTLRRGAVAAAG